MTHFRSAPITPGIAFITGGARGLGNAIAVSFAKDGAKGVALVDIQDEATFSTGKASVEKYGAKCITIHADVTKEEDIERAVKECVKEFGRIDYAANFAGIVGPLDATWDVPVAAFRAVIEVNTIGVWLSMRAEMAQMLKQSPLGSDSGIEDGRVQQKGSIVNCASVNSILGGAGTTGYTSSKHAVLGMTKSAALEVRGQGIRVNCVSPGFLRTKLLDAAFDGSASTSADSKEGQEGTVMTDMERTWKGYTDRQGREATSFEEVGDVVVLLSTPRMSLVVGHNLVIDGGFTINENAM